MKYKMQKIEKMNEIAWPLGIIFCALGVALCTKASFGLSIIAIAGKIPDRYFTFEPWLPKLIEKLRLQEKGRQRCQVLKDSFNYKITERQAVTTRGSLSEGGFLLHPLYQKSADKIMSLPKFVCRGDHWSPVIRFAVVCGRSMIAPMVNILMRTKRMSPFFSLTPRRTHRADQRYSSRRPRGNARTRGRRTRRGR